MRYGWVDQSLSTFSRFAWSFPASSPLSMFGSSFQAYDRRLQQPLATVCAFYKTYETFLSVHSKYAPNDHIVLREPNVHTVGRLQQLVESDGELWKRLRCVKIQLKCNYLAILDSIESNDNVVQSTTFRHDFDLMGTCYALHLCTEQVLMSFATLFEVSVVETVLKRQKKKTSRRPRSPSPLPSPEKEFRGMFSHTYQSLLSILPLHCQSLTDVWHSLPTITHDHHQQHHPHPHWHVEKPLLAVVLALVLVHPEKPPSSPRRPLYAKALM